MQVNGMFVIAGTTVDDNGVEREDARYFQKPDGRLPLSPVDTDARWRTSRPDKPSGLHYQENVIVDLGGFIVSRGVTHASDTTPVDGTYPSEAKPDTQCQHCTRVRGPGQHAIVENRTAGGAYPQHERR